MILRGSELTWTFADRVLAVASVLSDDLRCPGCGQPKHEAWNPDSEGWYEVKEATCQGCAELERKRESDGSAYHPDVKRWVMDTRPPDQRLREWNPLGD